MDQRIANLQAASAPKSNVNEMFMMISQQELLREKKRDERDDQLRLDRELKDDRLRLEKQEREVEHLAQMRRDKLDQEERGEKREEKQLERED